MDTNKTIIACATVLGGGFLAHVHPDLKEAIFPIISFVVGHIFGNGAKKNGS